MESPILSQRELRRYAKQIMLGEIGLKGQEKLKRAKVLVVGAGGLGCAVLQYLTAAGIGKIGIAEFDNVDESNLQRQVLYGSDDLSKLKSIIAKNRLEILNSFVEIDIHNLQIKASNALKIMERYDIIIDATDNFEARYVISDSCVKLKKPMIHGSIYKYEGTVSVFNYRGGPTYRCYNPESDLLNHKNSVNGQSGLFGVLPGITGILMANETIKVITDAGDILSGKILAFNILKNTFRLLTLTDIQGNH